jgi:hypothetical protein
MYFLGRKPTINSLLVRKLYNIKGATETAKELHISRGSVYRIVPRGQRKSMRIRKNEIICQRRPSIEDRREGGNL